jgi:alkanesulfonate monooxygenase SsuD/methylene tetrahydromethanopterin reductase-like flavin-dependent oxidoreductase (luciferase family)
MVNVGYTLMTEQAGPGDLVRWAARAEDAGFDLLAISDHYFPWLDEQGHAPSAWVTLGAVAQATGRAENALAVIAGVAALAHAEARTLLARRSNRPGQSP